MSSFGLAFLKEIRVLSLLVQGQVETGWRVGYRTKMNIRELYNIPVVFTDLRFPIIEIQSFIGRTKENK